MVGHFISNHQDQVNAEDRERISRAIQRRSELERLRNQAVQQQDMTAGGGSPLSKTNKRHSLGDLDETAPLLRTEAPKVDSEVTTTGEKSSPSKIGSGGTVPEKRHLYV